MRVLELAIPRLPASFLSSPDAGVPWGILALNAGLLVVTLVAVAIPTIRLLRKVRTPRIRGGIPAVLAVISSALPPHGAIRANCPIVGVIAGEGIAATPVSRDVIAPVACWPWPGVRLPVMVDPTHPARFAVRWDMVPDSGAAARAQAESHAHELNGHPGPGGSPEQPGPR